MKKFFQIFFITLGVIFFILILVGIYLYIADPFNIKSLFNGEAASPPQTTDSKPVDKNPLLSPAQEQALEKVGIDPAAVPSQITPAMEQCFYAKLGEKRATEIKNGSAPTFSDYLAARSCVQ